MSTQQDKYVRQANTMQPSIIIVTGLRFLELWTKHENIFDYNKLLVRQQYPQEYVL